MRNYIFCSFLFLLGCKDVPKEQAVQIIPSESSVLKNSKITEPSVLTIDSIKLGINFKATGDYSQLKTNIRQKRTYFKNMYRSNAKKAIDSCGAFLEKSLINQLVPHWYGTVWDFNGYTNIPNEGVIACGYFVSTTLKHLGFKLNRYKMAQQAGLNEALTLQAEEELRIYRNLDYSALKKQLITTYEDGIYFIGLSNHVGYLLIKDKELYFLHASYCDDKVVIEKAENAPCFQSDIYVTASIFNNKELIRKWIFELPMPVVKD